MRVVVFGGSGVLGRAVVAAGIAAGHEVVTPSRSDASAARLSSLGATPAPLPDLETSTLARAVAGADGVVNVLTHLPGPRELWRPGAFAENDHLRRVVTARVARAVREADVGVLVQDGLALTYRRGGARWLDEDEPLDPAGPLRSVAAAERNVLSGAAGRARVVRLGFLVAPGSTQARGYVALARRGFSAQVAPPGAYVPTTWFEDAGSAIVHALGVPPGAYNAVDLEPPTAAEVDAALAAVVGRTRLQRAPARLLGHLTGGGVFRRSIRPTSARLHALGWTPTLRGGVQGWARVAAEEPDTSAAVR